MLNNRILQGFLALAPFVMGMLIIIFYFSIIFSLISNVDRVESSDESSVEFLKGLGIIVILMLVMILITVFSFVYFIIHAAKNPNLEENNIRLLWILIIVLIGGIGSLVYWIVEIASKRPKPIIN